MTRRRSFLRRFKNVALGLLALVVVLSLAEGFVSLALFAFDLAAEGVGPLPERSHTRHDPELGWVNVPGERVADLYGPGLGVTINAQGLRNREDFAPRVPPGRWRVVCSGDSFTFGFGVGDDDSWPAALAALDERLEVANMAQAGYGLDQIYLWYRRDGGNVEHQVHVLAVVIDDIWRMRFPTFIGYGKPTLKLEDGVPVADGVPVPGRGYFLPWMTQNMELFRRLRTAQLVGRLLPQEARPLLDDAVTWRLATAAVGVLAEQHRAEGRAFLVVFLPTAHDHFPSEFDAQRRAFLDALEERGVDVLDLVPALRQVPRERLGELFIKPGEIDYSGAVGHYNAQGGRFVAGRIWPKLEKMLTPRPDP